MGTRKKKQIEIAWDSGQLPMTAPACALAYNEHFLQPLLLQPLPTRAKTTIAEESAQLVGMELAWHLKGARVAITGVCEGGRSGAIWNSDWCAKTVPTHVPAPTWYLFWSLFSGTAPLWGKGAITGSGESTHLEETEPALTRTLGYLLQQLGTQHHPW